MAKKSYPEYHKALLAQSVYPSAPRRIKFEETHRSFLYRTGSHLYKIRKPSALYSSLEIKERFLQEALVLGRRWCGDTVEAVVPIVRTAHGYAPEGEGTVVDYALRLSQLSDHFWLHALIPQGKVTPTAIGRLSRFLADNHREGALEERVADAGRPEHLLGLMEENLYQSKKYLSLVVSDAILEMIARPVARFVEDFRKLMLRRMKRGRIVDGHGAFIPEHVYIRGMDIRVVSPLEGQPKYRRLDGAGDVAAMMNELTLLGSGELADLFCKRYISATRDRDLHRVLPAYQTFRAVREGLLRSEWMAEMDEKDPAREDLMRKATAYFNLAVQTAREIPRPD